MRFTLDASGAQAAGDGLGSVFKAFVMGPMYRQQAEQDTAKKLAETYAANMHGNERGANAVRYGAEADKLGAETKGLTLTNNARMAPVDAGLPSYLQNAFKLFQATGETNMARFADAGTSLQSQGIRDQAVANVGNVDVMNKFATLAKPGEAYLPFKAVGDTGASINQATGDQPIVNEVLQRLFATESGAKAGRDTAAANASTAAAGASNASARQRNAEAQLIGARLQNFLKTGRTSGTGDGEGDPDKNGGALSSTIINTLKIPALDAKGRPVRNPITGEQEYTIDQEALRKFYSWASNGNRRPTATAFSQWEAQGRPGTDKNPAPPAAAPTMPKRSDYKSADEVRAAFKAGTISRDQARTILQSDFGMK